MPKYNSRTGSKDEAPANLPDTAAVESGADPKDLAIAALQSQLAKIQAQLADLPPSISTASPSAVDQVTAVDDSALILYSPKINPDQPLTSSYLMVPIPDESVGGEGRTKTIALIPGLQKISAREAELLMATEAKPLKALISRGVIQLWSKTTTLQSMDEVKAQEAIRLTEGPSLLAAWTKEWHSLSKLVQDALVRRQDQLKSVRTTATRDLFGQQVPIN